jgi:hypothetical protein
MKNIQFLFDLCLTLNDVIDELFKLTTLDYISGPENDNDGTDGQIWKFRHALNNKTVYVKLKLFCEDKQDWVKIISFHEEEDRK